MGKPKPVNPTIISNIKNYLFSRKNLIRLRRASTDGVFAYYVSEDYRLITHDPQSYLTSEYPKKVSDSADLQEIAAKCRESCILENLHQDLVNNTCMIVEHNSIEDTDKYNQDACNEAHEQQIKLEPDEVPETPTKQMIVDEKLPNFNDTLEYIESLLQEGGEELPTCTPKIIEKSASSRIPVKKCTPRSLNKLKENDRRTSPRFKIPTAKCTSAKKTYFSHIESPIAALIHKSAQSPLIRHKNQNLASKIKLPKSQPFNQNAVQLPSVSYKSSNRIEILTTENILPNKIAKILGKPAEILKHQKLNKTPKALPKGVQEDDLTFRESLSHTDSDTSFITLRKHY